jgi:hypothetical protein
VIAALYVATGGCYFGLPDVEPWDETRDARKYDGPWPVVAHPPCQRWSMLAAVVEARWGQRRGDDGGTFAAALAALRRWGGVLEHPAESRAWPTFGLPRPCRGWSRALLEPRLWVCAVDQYWYGHDANKPTWLAFIGDAPPPALDWRPGRSRVLVCSAPGHGAADRAARGVTLLRKSRHDATPIPFRDLLLDLARGAR